MNKSKPFVYGYTLGEPAKKPPLGAMPRHIWDSKRMSELKAAIERYLEEDLPVRVEWAEEYNELAEKYKKL